MPSYRHFFDDLKTEFSRCMKVAVASPTATPSTTITAMVASMTCRTSLGSGRRAVRFAEEEAAFFAYVEAMSTCALALR